MRRRDAILIVLFVVLAAVVGGMSWRAHGTSCERTIDSSGGSSPQVCHDTTPLWARSGALLATSFALAAGALVARAKFVAKP